MQALLRVDLGARINLDPAVGSVDIEGRFLKEDVVMAIEALGYYIVSVEPKPRSILKYPTYFIA